MTEFKADLHCHSTCSDGQLTPVELVHKAASIGLKGLSITDHDTIEAYSRELFKEAENLNILICPGVEFSCQIRGVSVHILGYDFDINSTQIKELCTRHKFRRKERNKSILKKLSSKGIVIGEEELDALPHTNVIGRPHIAYVMMQKGIVGSIQEAFHKFLGDGKSCYDPGESFAVEETIRIIHDAGGKAFIAHPHLVKRKKVLRELLQNAFDGLECYYASFSRRDNEKWLQICKEKGWLVSGGSDFHGDLKPYNALGSSWVDKETFDKICSLHDKT